MRSGPIRVLVVDDSVSARHVLTTALQHDPTIQVIGAAADAFLAARHMQTELPDVLLLDVEMPRMDGLTFLRRIMAQRPIPCVICSKSAGPSNPALAQEALDAGAVGIVAKPCIDTPEAAREFADTLCRAVRAAAKNQVARPGGPAPIPQRLTADAILPKPQTTRAVIETDRVVCIGISTGGTETLRAVLQRLSPSSPAIAAVQHMPEGFTASFARRLDSLCGVSVKEAEDGDEMRVGRVLIAPGNRHMLLQRIGTHYRVLIKDGPPVSRHRPSVDVLFRSAAHYAGSNALGLIMTGMGDDGARGLLEMRHAGARTLAQDEQSCVVFGMPKEAINCGAAEQVVNLAQIGREISGWSQVGYSPASSIKA